MVFRCYFVNILIFLIVGEKSNQASSHKELDKLNGENHFK